jgi:hypothetical protein
METVKIKAFDYFRPHSGLFSRLFIQANATVVYPKTDYQRHSLCANSETSSNEKCHVNRLRTNFDENPSKCSETDDCSICVREKSIGTNVSGAERVKGFFSPVSVCNTRTCFCRWYLIIPLVSYRIVITRAVFDTGVGSAQASILNCRRFPLHYPFCNVFSRAFPDCQVIGSKSLFSHLSQGLISKDLVMF